MTSKIQCSVVIISVLFSACSIIHSNAKKQTFSWQNPLLDSSASKHYQPLDSHEGRVAIKSKTSDSIATSKYRPVEHKVSTIVKLPQGFSTIKIFFGTDRNKISKDGKSLFFGTETTILSHKYSVGFTTVTIPDDHVKGIIDKNSYLKCQFFTNPENSMIEKSITVLSDHEFDNAIKNNSSKSDAFIFVHGFNNSFEDAALRTAQLARDIDSAITPFMYSWASNGKKGDYITDGTNVALATTFFLDFLKRIAKSNGYKHLHIIAHSMGNRLVATTMDSLAISGDYKKLRISEIIMAAPDIDTLTFKSQYAATMSKCADRVTVYGAKNDWALIGSNIVGKYLRVGQYSKPPFYVNNVNNIDFINADSVKTDFLGHDRFAESSTILSDINLLIKTNKSPIDRGVPHEDYLGHIYYFFKRETTPWHSTLYYNF